MGSMIHLAVGHLEVDWGKNNGFVDHSALFQVTDVKDVPYFYYEDSNGNYGEEAIKKREDKIGLSKPLKEVFERIELLGHTMEYCEKEFLFLSKINDFDANIFNFSTLKTALSNVDVNSVSLDYGYGGEGFGKFFKREIYPRLGLDKNCSDAKYIELHCGEAMENLSPYSVLRLLASNQSAVDLPVIWAFSDLVENGWAKKSAFVRPLDASNRFLIVTEGTSDAKILKHAFSILKPHVADFFDYVDMEEGYPFSGTGNVINFVKGLISISVQNNIVVLFDNDAEGVSSYNKCNSLNVPNNMKILKLPNLAGFENFETVGPNGKIFADINGKGAAIECYLDLDEKACIRWNNYNSQVNEYQGELIGKDKYKRLFLEQREKAIDYNYTKLHEVLKMIVQSCIQMKEAAMNISLEESNYY